jgi:hypothetical protein
MGRMALVVATRTVLPVRYIPAFLWGCLLCSFQARRTPGHITEALAVSPRRMSFWTLSVWADSAAMNAFRNSGAHAKFLPRLPRWAREGATTAWQTSDDRLPTWAEAQSQFEQRSHMMPLRRPGPNQLNQHIPPLSGPMLKAPFL